jgi:hypothetical protein
MVWFLLMRLDGGDYEYEGTKNADLGFMDADLRLRLMV